MLLLEKEYFSGKNQYVDNCLTFIYWDVGHNMFSYGANSYITADVNYAHSNFCVVQGYDASHIT